MKKIFSLIIIGLLLLIGGTVITSGERAPSGIVIDCGSIYLSTAANPDICQCIAYDNPDIDVDDGDYITIEVDYTIICTSWDDTGYVRIELVGTTLYDEDSSGDIKTGTLRIYKYFNPDEEFVVRLWGKIDYQYSSDLEDEDYSYCSTLPYTPPQPELQWIPSSYTFEQTPVGERRYKDFILTNIGTGTANGHAYLTDLDDFYLSGGDDIDFSLDAYEEIIITVVFYPQSQGGKSTILVADASNCPDVEAYIGGTAPVH